MNLPNSLVDEIDSLTKEIAFNERMHKRELDNAFDHGRAEANAYWVERIRAALSLLNVN